MKLEGYALDAFAVTPAKESFSTRHRRTAVALNVAALVLGPLLGCALIFWQLRTPELRSMSGPIAPGAEQVVNVAWPVAAMLDGRAPAINVEVAVSGRIADEVSAVVDMIDPDDPALRHEVGRFDSLAGTIDDGLVTHRRVFDLEPLLRNSRGVLRKFDVPNVKFAVRVERLMGSRAGFVYLTAAEVVAAPNLQTGETSSLTHWTKRR
ncbi:MAG: hypothetical protein SFV19_06125 [Rhodospirillaceae bacterium]|nr:hypothetical protein [Rhodospirillaceae bacterium]